MGFQSISIRKAAAQNVLRPNSLRGLPESICPMLSGFKTNHCQPASLDFKSLFSAFPGNHGLGGDLLDLHIFLRQLGCLNGFHELIILFLLLMVVVRDAILPEK